MKVMYLPNGRYIRKHGFAPDAKKKGLVLIVKVTAAALEQLKEVLNRESEGLYIRIYISGMG
jgi:hypothetical protein